MPGLFLLPEYMVVNELQGLFLGPTACMHRHGRWWISPYPLAGTEPNFPWYWLGSALE
jgi:hypothetical protein